MRKEVDTLYRLIRENDFISAEKKIKNLLNQNIENLEYNFINGLLLARRKEFHKALFFFKKVADVRKNDFDSNYNCANSFQAILNFDDAIQYYQECTRIDKKRFEPYFQIGNCFKILREYEKSIDNLNKSIEIKENHETYFLLANVYREMGIFNKARENFMMSLKLNKNFIKAELSLINLEIDEGNQFKAKEMLNNFLKNKCIDDKDKVLAKIHLGNVFRSEGNYTEAIKINQEILEIDPNNVDASYNLAICNLFIKEYKKGWLLHEKRFGITSLNLIRQINNRIKKPRWDNLKPKKNLLIWGEQGVGDQILYSQFIETFYDKFESINLAVNEKLITFFKKIYPKINVIDYKKIEKFDDYDYHLPIGSLGLYFQQFIKKQNIRRSISYPCKDIIPTKSKKYRCGLSWKSTNKLTGHKKSIELHQLQKIIKSENIEFVNLQYTDEYKEIKDLENKLKKEIFIKHDVDCFNDIDGTASLISSCDFIISVSNTNVHISGKLGVSTFLLLPQSDGKLWYWGLNSDKEIIWYPSVYPMRQQEEKNWDSCIVLLEKEIEKFL